MAGPECFKQVFLLGRGLPSSGAKKEGPPQDVGWWSDSAQLKMKDPQPRPVQAPQGRLCPLVPACLPPGPASR